MGSSTQLKRTRSPSRDEQREKQANKRARQVAGDPPSPISAPGADTEPNNIGGTFQRSVANPMLENVSSSTTPNSIVSNASGQPALQFGPVNDALLNKAQPSPTRLGHNDDPDDAPSVLDEVPASNAQQGLTDDGDLPSSPGLTPGAGKDQPLINAACVDKGASAAGLLSPFKQVTSTTDTPESALSSASNPDEHAPHVTEGIDPAAADEVALEGSENTGSDNFITTVSTEAMAALAIRSHLRSRHGVITDRLEPGQLMSLDEVAQVCLLTRLSTVMNFSDHGKRIYSAQNLPADCIWGSESAFGNLSKILCQKDTAQPISIWVVGEVASAWMFQRNGDPADRAAINFVPLSPEMRQICATQLRELSVPVASVAASNWGPEQVRAYTWMNKGAPIKGTGGIAPPPPEFTEFYDATTKLQDKVVMNKLPITDLKEHDLVLVEAAVQRYAVHDQGRQPARGYRRSLDKWAAYYDLQAVYLLNKAVGSSRRSNAPTLGLSI